MHKLSDTQTIILSGAAQRSDGNVLPPPGSLRGGAAGKVVGALLSRGLIREQAIDATAKADPAHNTIWRNLEDGCGVMLLVTGAGLDAIGIDSAVPLTSPRPTRRTRAPTRPHLPLTARDHSGKPDAASASHTAPRVRRTRVGTKQAALVEILKRTEGATIAEIVAVTAWQPRTVRGALAGALKKRLGLEVTSEKIEARGRVYGLAR